MSKVLMLVLRVYIRTLKLSDFGPAEKHPHSADVIVALQESMVGAAMIKSRGRCCAHGTMESRKRASKYGRWQKNSALIVIDGGKGIIIFPGEDDDAATQAGL